MNSKVKRILIVLTIVALAIVAVVVSVVLVPRNARVIVNLVVTPVSSKVTIDGDDHTGENSINLTVGTHRMEVEKFGFNTYIENLRVSGPEDAIVYVALEPNILVTQNWYDYHPDDAKIREVAKVKMDEKLLAMAVEKYPGIGKLPYDGESFRLSYTRCVPDVLYEGDCVLIEAKYKTSIMAAIDYFRKNIDEKLGEYYFVYSGDVEKSPFDFNEGVYSIEQVPLPTEENDGYGVSIFELDGKVYRALFLKINGVYIISGVPAPILKYSSFVGVPTEVIDYVNAMEIN